MKTAPYFLLALLAGAFLPLQAGINGQLKAFVGGPIQTAFVSFTAGALALLAFMLVTRTAFASGASSANGWLWIGGGLLGASYVSLIILLTPILGVALTFGLIVAGQMAMSLTLDHFGWFGLPMHPVNLWRLVGAGMIVGGVVIIRRF